MINTGFPKREKISEAVLATFRANVSNYQKWEGRDDIYPPVFRTTIVTYLFNLSPRDYYCKKIDLTLASKANKQKYVTFKLNGIVRVCPVMDQHEEALIRILFDYLTKPIDSIDFTKKYLGTVEGFTNSRQRVDRQIHNDSLAVFRRLGIPLENEKMAIKALRDIRVADAVINWKVDWGFMKVYGIGLRKRRFLENNMFINDIGSYLVEELGIRSYMRRSYRT